MEVTNGTMKPLSRWDLPDRWLDLQSHCHSHCGNQNGSLESVHSPSWTTQKYSKGSRRDVRNDLSCLSPDSHPSKFASRSRPLDILLKEPFEFCSASELTAVDEMVVLRSQKLLQNHSGEHRRRRERLRQLVLARRGKPIWPAQSTRPVGFSNPGVFCYRRSVMQSMMHLPPTFTHWLRECREKRPCHAKLQPTSCLFCSMYALVEAVRTNKRTEGRNVTYFDTALRQMKGRDFLRSRDQEDAMEVLGFFLEKFQECFDFPSGITDSLFFLNLVSTYQCEDCNGVVTNNTFNEPCMMLPLKDPLGGGSQPEKNGSRAHGNSGNARSHPLPLDTYIDAFFQDRVKVKCSVCNSDRERTRTYKINAAPEVLTVALKRFEQTGYGDYRKVNTKVAIPQWLDLRRHVMPDPNAKKTGSLRYKLSSVVAHSGTLRSGHYVAYAERTDGVWQFNDSCVKPVTLKEVLDPNPYAPGLRRTF